MNGVDSFACWYKFRKTESYFNNFWLGAFKTGRGLLGNETLRMKWLIELIFDTLIKWVWLCRWYDFKICWISKIFKIWWNWLMSWFCAADTKSWHLKVTLIILGDGTLKSTVSQWIDKLSWFFFHADSDAINFCLGR